MSIWIYSTDTQRKPTRAEYESSDCIFCRLALNRLGAHQVEQLDDTQGGSATITVFACPLCGWWKATGLFSGKDWNQDLLTEARCSQGSLVDLAIQVASTPV